MHCLSIHTVPVSVSSEVVQCRTQLMAEMSIVLPVHRFSYVLAMFLFIDATIEVSSSICVIFQQSC